MSDQQDSDGLDAVRGVVSGLVLTAIIVALAAAVFALCGCRSTRTAASGGGVWESPTWGGTNYVSPPWPDLR